jgi:hypothetical protein
MIVPRRVFPFAVAGIRHTQLAIPFATTWVAATIRFDATVALHPTVPPLTGPPVSFSSAASVAANCRPDFAGFGDVVNAVTLRSSLVNTW